MAPRPSNSLSRFSDPFHVPEYMYRPEDPDERAIRELLGWERPILSAFGPLDPDGYDDCGGNADERW